MKRRTNQRKREGGGGGGCGVGGASRDRYLGDSAISRGRQISVNPGSLARLMPGFHLRAHQAEGKVWDGWVTIHRRRCHCRPPPPPSYGCNEVGGLGIQRVPCTHTHTRARAHIDSSRRWRKERGVARREMSKGRGESG